MLHLDLVLDQVVPDGGADPAGLQEDLTQAGGAGLFTEDPALVTEALTQQEVRGLLQSPLYGLAVRPLASAGQVLAQFLVKCRADLFLHQHCLL